jgi:hypothetical protein
MQIICKFFFIQNQVFNLLSHPLGADQAANAHTLKAQAPSLSFIFYAILNHICKMYILQWSINAYT